MSTWRGAASCSFSINYSLPLHPLVILRRTPILLLIPCIGPLEIGSWYQLKIPVRYPSNVCVIDVTVHHNHRSHGPHTDSVCVFYQPNSVEGESWAEALMVSRGVHWHERFQRYADSQLTVGEFCALGGVSVTAFYVWRKTLAGGQPRRRTTASPAAAEIALRSSGRLSQIGRAHV